MTPSEARNQITKAEMRHAMYKWLWDQTHQAYGKIPAQPCPNLSDEEIERRLNEVLGITRLARKTEEGVLLLTIAYLFLFAAIASSAAIIEGPGDYVLLAVGVSLFAFGLWKFKFKGRGW